MEQDYCYEPLPERGSIRLLVIQPCADEEGQALDCQLEHHAFDDKPSYEALSYTWGTGDETLPLRINGRRAVARKNLVDALRAIRQATEPRTFWVDAICINQGDVEERNQQVLQMKEIYSRAQCVVVWLGEATDGCEAGMQLMRDISTGLREAGNSRIVTVGSTAESGTGTKGTIEREEFLDYYKPVFTLLGDPENVKALDESVQLLSNPWWARMWTLQESVLGGRVVVHCGRFSIPLEPFFDLAYFIFLATNFDAWPGAPVDAHVAVREVWRVADLRAHIAERGYISLLLALDSSWNRGSTDPRDKIIGLLGLTRSNSSLKPDYLSTVARIYRQAFIATAAEEKDLTFLGLLSESRHLRGSDLPTWVPDLRLHFNHINDHLASLSKSIFNRYVYNASLNQSFGGPPPMRAEEDDTILVLSGTEVDVATSVRINAPGKLSSSDENEAESWKNQMRLTIEDWRSHAPLSSEYCHTNEPAVLAFWRCVLVDLKQGFHQGFDPGKPRRMHAGDWMPFLEQDSTQILDQLLSFWVGLQMRLTEQLNRRFFVTSKGYVGLGPPWMLENDVVCVLRGGPVPYVLRPSRDGTWAYVGEW